jgi:diadenosine tetraphosphate (Ap4A) HIT family hydrolase
MFRLHKRLQADTVLVAEFPLSLVLLSKDANYPWIILVPKRQNIEEIYQLDIEDRQQLLHESCVLAETMTALFQSGQAEYCHYWQYGAPVAYASCGAI